MLILSSMDKVWFFFLSFFFFLVLSLGDIYNFEEIKSLHETKKNKISLYYSAEATDSILSL